MANKIIQQKLYRFKRPSRWDSGLGAEMPEAYKKFWKEWKLTQPAAVHYIEKEGKFEMDERLGMVVPIQNVPLPLKYPKELNDGIWGGEAVVQGFVKKSKWRRRVPHFWVPSLQKSVLYSEVLDTHMRATVTKRTLDLIHENYGFDHYLLKTLACDLRSELALGIKRKILLALADQTLYPENPKKKEEVLAKYQQYLEAYTREEIEWYGLTWEEACKKWARKKLADAPPVQPLKHVYRSELIAKLKEAQIQLAADVETSKSGSSWMSKLNPFTKTPKEQ
ncbi:39S ribosomal protein L28, mitochondrial [Venturia canescens]|uniref:39S ribosomal protein L28, mitochondrial n=1 Tax=Venturia canescens TaxID=32260 RepID=UPI001C9D21E0|nr:39S ribosomal protein L28, mitochondrial [Venturia canescens]